MRFEWDMYHKYDDGSQSRDCDVTVYDDNGNILTNGVIEDHTLPDAKEHDKKWGRDIPYGYNIIGFGDWLNRNHFRTTFLAHGFTDDDFGAFGYGGMGICKNEQYRSHPHEYTGTPKCIIHDVMDMVEETFCKSLFFSYNDELDKFKKQLAKRQKEMDEAMAYLDEKVERKKEAEREYAAEFQNELEV